MIDPHFSRSRVYTRQEVSGYNPEHAVGYVLASTSFKLGKLEHMVVIQKKKNTDRQIDKANVAKLYQLAHFGEEYIV